MKNKVKVVVHVNCSGPYVTTAEKDMDAYDRLPPRIRETLRECRFDWAAQQVWSFKNKYGVDRTIDELQRLDREAARR